MDNQGTTNNNNNDEGMMNLGTTSSNDEDHLRVLVAFDGEWLWDGKEWLFMDSVGSIIVVSKYVTLSQITDSICTKFDVDQSSYDLKLEVHYRGGSPWFPIIEIKDDHDLSVFISESWKTKLPLCVTALLKDDESEGVEQDEINPDIEEESHGRNEDRVDERLLKAIRKNDWVKAQDIVNTKQITWTSRLDNGGNTALHLVVGSYKDNKVFTDILKGMNSELLVTTINNNGMNPAHTAAYFNNTEALKIMSESNPKCFFEYENFGYLPILCTLSNDISFETFHYLFKQMKSCKVEYNIFLRGTSGPALLCKAIHAGWIDVAYELIDQCPTMTTKVYEKGQSPLELITQKPELFYNGAHYNLCQRFVYHHVPIENNSLGSTDTADVENQETPRMDKFVTKHTRRCLHDVISRICVKLWEKTLLHVPHVKQLKDDKVKHNKTIKLLRRICEDVDRTNNCQDVERVYRSAIYSATGNNIAEAIDVLTEYFVGLHNEYDPRFNFFEMTVLNRNEKVFNYILHHERQAKHAFSKIKDSNGNNILHKAGRLAPMYKRNAASGAALEMQRELQWFEEVKKMVPQAYTLALNKYKKTPMMVFREAHNRLREDGEEWMKKTADSYTITAALIITIVFAAAITVPGGNDSATGKPIYETKASLIIFAISDAISLFTSATSLLWFLSILTARYADEDFLYKLPKRLICGLVMLFVSVTSMMIAFSAALYIMFGQGKAWILIPIGALACLPIASFVTLQFPLLVELISSTYGHGIFGKEKDWQSSANTNKKKRT